MTYRRTAAALVAVLMVLLTFACAGPKKEDQSQSAPSQASTSTQNPQAVPGNSTAMNPAAPARKDLPTSRLASAAVPTFEVQLLEYEIRMPDTLAAGKSTAVIVNAGKENHSFEVNGPGYHAALPEPLARGDRMTLDLDLRPGTYTVDCPMDEHKGKGMSRTLTVR
jgi:hypothetical protein